MDGAPGAVRPPNRKALVLGLLGLAAFLAVEALLLRSFIRTDTRPPSWDQSIHLQIALDYREALKAGRPGDAWHLAPKPGMPAFPPLYHLLLMRAYDTADPAHQALWANWLYLALLAAAVFGIAWHFKPDATALAVALAFCASPGVQELYTTQLLDLPVTALAAAAYWALLASNGFWWWPGSILFGLLHAAGLLHKWSFFSYMLPAYFVWGKALVDKRSLPRALVAAGLGVGLAAPWYWAHLALMPGRLVSASADFAAPATTIAAWLAYPEQAATVLGPVLWALGILGAITPQYQRRREHGWILASWLLVSYVFWTLVPNRQIRFLLPALPPLAVGLASTWPRAVTWAVAAVQLALMANFYAGSVGPAHVVLPGGFAFEAFWNKPAKAEDWKLDEILRRVEKDRDPSLPVANVTLVANDDYFNAPALHWSQRKLGLDRVRVRGVNQRLCELSEFVLLKDPKLGPASVTGGLPVAAMQVKDPRGWFARAYEEDARWPLPDKSEAILYRQRRGLPRPIAKSELVIDGYDVGHVSIQGLRARFGPWDAARSAYGSVAISAGAIDVRGLTARRPAVELDGVGFVTVAEDRGWSDVRLLKLDRLKVLSLEVNAEQLKAFAEARVKGLELSELKLDGTIKASGRWRGQAVSAEAALVLLDAPRRLVVDVRSASWAGIPIPTSLFREIKELTVPLEPSAETPFAIELAGLTISGGKLTVP